MVTERSTWLLARSRVALVVLFTMALTSAASAALGQGRANRPRAAEPQLGADAGVSPAEIQRLFDAYVVMQAQQELELSDEQYPTFLSRVRALQDVRRRTDVERNRRMQILRRIALDQASNESDIRVQLKELRDFNERVATEIGRAEENVTQVLSVRQQARFQVFQDAMERRKAELLMRARQANRPRP